MWLSGSEWVCRFPASRRIDDLSEPFRDNVRRFVAALQAAHAVLSVADTLRPPERAYLMHYSFQIAREGLDPSAVEAMPGVDIQWVHTDREGNPDIAASRAAAAQMVRSYGIVCGPASISRHTEGRAIDMTITWENDLTIADADGAPFTVSILPRNGGGNADLHRIGACYGVIKLLSDPPHWSSDGH